MSQDQTARPPQPATSSPAATACPTLTGERVRLRLHDAGDAPAIVETSNDPVAVEWTTVPQPYGDGEAQWWVGHMHAGWEKRAAGDDSGVMGWAVDVRDEAGEWTFAGQVEVRPIGGGVGELGLVLHPAARGRGLMVEAGRLAMRWATTTGGLDTLHWRTAVGNWASRRVGWRLGFRFSGAIRGLMPQERATFDGWIGTWAAGEPIEPAHPWHVPTTLEAPAGADGAGRALPAVRLRAWAEGDRPTQGPDALAERFMPGMLPPTDEAGFATWLTTQRTRMATGEIVAWAVVDPVREDVLGTVQLSRLGHPFYPDAAEVSYCLHAPARGTGMLQAALVLLADHAFTPADAGGLDLVRLSAGCETANRASAGTLLRAGFRHVGTERAASGSRHALNDGYTFELLRADTLPTTTPQSTAPAPRPAPAARARDEGTLPHPTLAGDGLALRPFTDADVPALAAVGGEAEHWEFAHAPGDEDDARAYVARLWERRVQGTDLTWAVVGAEGTDVAGELLGAVNLLGLADRHFPDTAEVGYWVNPAHRGQGVVGRALDLVLPFVVKPVAQGGLGRHRVVATTHEHNVASQHVLRRAGFTQWGTEPAAHPVDAADPAGERYAITHWHWLAGTDRARAARAAREQALAPCTLECTTADGEELTLSALTTSDEDLARVVEACRDPQSVHWLGGPGRIRPDYSRQNARGYAVALAAGAAEGTWVGWAIRSADGTVLGMIDVQGPGQRNLIGYWVHPDARRRGIVTAALRRVVRHALTPREANGMGLHRVTIAHARGNEGSRRAIEAVGFHPVGTLRLAEELGDGSLVDLQRYDLLPADLPAE